MVTNRLLLAIMGIFSLMFGGCVGQPQPEKLPEITSESEEGFHDLVFYVREHKKLPDGGQTLRAYGMHQGRQVGIEVSLGPTWKQGSLGADIPTVTYQGMVRCRSIGAESDLLLQILDKLYDTKQAPKVMSKETVFTGITLGGDPRDLGREPVKIKLFFESDDEDRYAELFANIDLKARKLYLSEKAPEYRSAIIRALRAD